jgi:hypothetical protein
MCPIISRPAPLGVTGWLAPLELTAKGTKYYKDGDLN